MKNYILDIEEFKGLNMEDIITEEIINKSKESADKEFSEYIKLNKDELLVKKAGSDYFIAIYLLIKSNKTSIQSGFKTKLRNIIIDNYGIDNKIQNLDFYLGSCGITAQELAQK
jgi:hypothetical protein